MDLKKISNSPVWERDFKDWDEILDYGILKCEGILDETKIMISIMRTGKIIEDIHSKFLFEKFDLSISQLSILEILYFTKNKYLNQIELANKVYSSKANISSILNRMEDKNLIQRKIDLNNKRIKKILITKNGKQLVEKVLNILNSHKFEILKDIDSKSLIELLLKIRTQSKNHLFNNKKNFKNQNQNNIK